MFSRTRGSDVCINVVEKCGKWALKSLTRALNLTELRATKLLMRIAHRKERLLPFLHTFSMSFGVMWKICLEEMAPSAP